MAPSGYVYILPEWWIDRERNEFKVHELIKELSKDLIVEGVDREEWEIMWDLEATGESIILEKIKNNEL